MQNTSPLKFGFALYHARIGQPVLWGRHENSEQWGSPRLVDRRSERKSIPSSTRRSRRLAIVGRRRRSPTRTSRRHSSNMGTRSHGRTIWELRDDTPMGENSFRLSAQSDDDSAICPSGEGHRSRLLVMLRLLLLRRGGSTCLEVAI